MAYTNTLKIFETLRLAFDENQATKITEAVETAIETNDVALLESVATKTDIAEVKAEVKAGMAGVKAELTEVKVGVKAELTEVKSGVKADIAEVKAYIAETKAELIKWMFIFWIGQFASIVGVLTVILFAFFKR